MIRVKASTLWALGPRNLLRVTTYRALLRLRLHPVQWVSAPVLPTGEFYSAAPSVSVPIGPDVTENPALLFFGWYQPTSIAPPDWHQDFLTLQRIAQPSLPWWRIGDFGSGVSDIKNVWEASRMDWVLNFAVHARQGEVMAIDTLNSWLRDWATRNPAYLGPNWKCGQEASIRVIHLAVAALILGQETIAPAPLRSLIELHLNRIAPTVGYAVGQDNNHGTSEAAALFIGGSILARHGGRKARDWSEMGRALLAERVARLVDSDGSFSQYSVNYHRLLLDTLNLVEVWRRANGLEVFDNTVGLRAAAATHWLHGMTNPESGDAPNIGANDGANMLPLTAAGIRDFRPSVQLGAALWLGQNAYPTSDVCRSVLSLLRIPIPASEMPAASSALHAQGGYALIRRNVPLAPLVVMRFPRYRFRPSHADPMHVDLWVGTRNVLRDGGTFSYAADQCWQDYFFGMRSHNTVQFDDREAMPRLSRFLWGKWLTTTNFGGIEEHRHATCFAASYRDWCGATHERRVALTDDALVVVDTVSAFATRAVLRWRLAPGPWNLDGLVARNGEEALTVSADVPIACIRLVEGWESREYQKRTTLPVLEFEIARPGTITSEYRWAA